MGFAVQREQRPRHGGNGQQEIAPGGARHHLRTGLGARQVQIQHDADVIGLCHHACVGLVVGDVVRRHMAHHALQSDLPHARQADQMFAGRTFDGLGDLGQRSQRSEANGFQAHVSVSKGLCSDHYHPTITMDGPFERY